MPKNLLEVVLRNEMLDNSNYELSMGTSIPSYGLRAEVNASTTKKSTTLRIIRVEETVNEIGDMLQGWLKNQI